MNNESGECRQVLTDGKIEAEHFKASLMLWQVNGDGNLSFRDHMRVNRSGSEDTIQAALSSAGLTRGCVTGWGFEFTCDEALKFGVLGTWVDRYWPHAKLVVFFDGQPHLKQHQRARDENVTACLEARGLTVKRYAYHAPITKKRLAEIVADLSKTLRPLP